MTPIERAAVGRPPAVDRATLLAAAIKLLRNDGPNALTVRRLTALLGVSRQVVYTQFGSIGGLLDALYREGFVQLRAAGAAVDPGLRGTDRVVAHALAYRRSALDRPELYRVMFEQPFREYTPSEESRSFALAAFEPLVEAVASSGCDRREARNLALTVWGAIHGLVHLELQGYFDFEATSEPRIEATVRGLVHRAQ
jgi:AcrR family transcriptional regulator